MNKYLFNADQRSYMEYLARTDPKNLCWCGWDHVGKCSTPSKCPADVSSADKLNIRCPDCGNDPGPHYDRPITHTIWCPRNIPKPPKHPSEEAWYHWHFNKSYKEYVADRITRRELERELYMDLGGEA
jgi:hypothetical protein